MTAEEAIKNMQKASDEMAEEVLRDAIEFHKSNAENFWLKGFNSIAYRLKTIADALGTQISKKPRDVDERECDGSYWLGFICPACGNSVIGQPYRPNNCKHCGQKLDWN